MRNEFPSLLAALMLACCIATLAACSDTPARDPGGKSTAEESDPWRIGGSVGGGPVWGGQPGPYSSRP